MKPGDLAEVIIPIPSLFEQIGGDQTRIIKSGDIVFLLKYEPTTWPRPHWLVVHDDQVGFIASRWLRPMKESPEEYIMDEMGDATCVRDR